MTTSATPRRRTSARRVLSTVLVLASVAGVELFAMTGSFDDRHDPFPHSATARP